MPIVTISMFEGRTREQKAELAKQITDSVVEVAKTPRDHVWIVFDDKKKSDWSIAGQLQDEL